MYKLSRPALFDVFEHDLSLYLPQAKGHFMCPICHRLFDRNNMGALSRAHFIPDGIGGRMWTLTCKDCNCNLGSEFDKHACWHANEALNPNKSRRIDLTWDDNGEVLSTTAELRLDKKAQDGVYLNLDFPDGRTNPLKNEKLFELMVNSSPDVKITIRARIPDPEKVRLSWLTASLLICFHNVGYEFLFSPLGESMLSAIYNKKLPEGCILLVATEEDLAAGVYLYDRSDTRPGIGVALPSARPTPYNFVFMPGLLDELEAGTFADIPQHKLSKLNPLVGAEKRNGLLPLHRAYGKNTATFRIVNVT